VCRFVYRGSQVDTGSQVDIAYVGAIFCEEDLEPPGDSKKKKKAANLHRSNEDMLIAFSTLSGMLQILFTYL